MWLNIALIEWIGYLASTIVLVSLSLSSLVKLRIFNLIGSAIFSFYGFYIGSLPVGIMNLIIVFFNIYYLRLLLFQSELFDVVKVRAEDEYLQKFLTFHRKDINEIFPDFRFHLKGNETVLLALRNANVAGVFIITSSEEGLAEILLDYVIPPYRDNKTGQFLLNEFITEYKEAGCRQIRCHTTNRKHKKYVKKLGFVSQEDQSSDYFFNFT